MIDQRQHFLARSGSECNAVRAGRRLERPQGRIAISVDQVDSLAALMDGDRIRQAGVDPGQRAEQLDLEHFFALAGILAREISGDKV